jgi:hypothetical protein
MNAREAIHRRRAAVSGAVVVLGLVVGGFWWHPAWAIGFVLVIVVWLGSSAMPGAG